MHDAFTLATTDDGSSFSDDHFVSMDKSTSGDHSELDDKLLPVSGVRLGCLESDEHPFSKKLKRERCGTCEGCRETQCSECSFCKRARTSTICIFRLCVMDQRVGGKQIPEAWNILERREDKTSIHHRNLNDEIDLQPPGWNPCTKDETLSLPVQRKSPRKRLSTKRALASAMDGNSIMAQLKSVTNGIPIETEETTKPIALKPNTDSRGVQSKMHDQLRRLAERRCNNCAMCMKQDCGRCRSCDRNKKTTSRYRLNCLLKPCTKIVSYTDKVLPLPGFPVGWGFFFVDEAMADSSILSLHASRYLPKGLRLVLQRGEFEQVYTRMTVVARVCGYSKETMESKLQEFCAGTLGIKHYKEQNHELLTKRVFRKWTDLAGSIHTAYGVITDCFTSLTDGNHTFRIAHETVDIDDLKSIHKPLGTLEHISEKMAWGSHITYLKTINKPKKSRVQPFVPFHLRWIFPDCRYFDEEERLIMFVKGFRLVFTVQPSQICGAGLGLFLTVSDMTDEARQDLVLECGELLDLGPYAPLLAKDRKPFHSMIIKSFIYCWKNEVYSFDANGTNHETFDVTDDKTGELHEVADHNVLMRVNETDGIANPTVVADVVPNGGVNYYLGHHSEDHGELRITVDSPIELKIDYRESYEPVRVREGYPRVDGDELEKLRKNVDEEDFQALDDIATFTCNDIHDSISLVEGLFLPSWETKRLSLLRCLVVSIALLERIKAIEKEFDGFVTDKDNVQLICDNGFSEMRRTNLEARIKAVIYKMFEGLGTAAAIRTSIMSLHGLNSIMARYLGCQSVDELAKFDFAAFRERLVRLKQLAGTKT